LVIPGDAGCAPAPYLGLDRSITDERSLMYARIANFEGKGPDRLDEAIEANRSQIEAGLAAPPAGLEGVKEVWMLVDPESGATVDFTLFETGEELRRGHEAFNAMSPEDAEGQRTSVGLYQIAFRVERS
jgi:hypothetical protein